MPSNFLKTGLLLALLTAIFMSMGALVGGKGGLLIAFVIALATNAVSYWKSDQMVLRLNDARQVSEAEAPEFHALVRRLSERAGLPMPRVFIMDNPQPNAFATGRSPEHAVVCASTGLLRLLTEHEVEGVIAHELAHVKNRDTLTMTVAASIGGAISLFANMLQFGMIFGNRGSERGGFLRTLVAALLAPFAAMVVQMAVSRSREYQADAVGARLCGNPLWLASALAKISEATRRIPNPAVQAVPAMAHLFIINPLTGRGVDSWFSTHPSTENRIAELQRLAHEMGIASGADAPARGPVASAGRPAGSPSGRRGPWG